MTELSDYKRLVEAPMIRNHRATVAELHSALESKDAEIAEWRQAASVEAGLRREFLARAEAAESRISDLERQLAEETERCARVVDDAELISHDPGECRAFIAAAIRGGAK